MAYYPGMSDLVTTPARRSQTKRELRALIADHKGNIADIARALTKATGREVTRQAVSQRIHRAELDDFADRARNRNGIQGKHFESDAERRRVLAAIRRTEDRDAAARELGMSRRTLFRKVKQYGLGRDLIAGALGA